MPLTRGLSFAYHDAVIRINASRPYFDAWLRRTGRQLAASGRLTQVAMALAGDDGGSVEHWRRELRALLEGQRDPTLDLLTRIDGLLAGGRRRHASEDSQSFLFGS